MAQLGGDLDLALEAVGPDLHRQVRVQDLDRHRPAVLQVLREVDGRHPATAQLPVDPVAAGERRPEVVVQFHCNRLGRKGVFR
jgi:hypothetical protein